MNAVQSFPLETSGAFAFVDVPEDSKLLTVTQSETGEWLASYALSDFVMSKIRKQFIIVPVSKSQRKLDIQFFRFVCEHNNHLIFEGE